jgi:hypothetical protein
MPVPPAELNAHFTIEGPQEAGAAARAATQPSGLAREAGPGELMLTGSREAVLAALGDAVVAALDAGAYGLDVKLEAPTGARR